MDSFLLVGLGNPGLKYQYTRHNIGQLFLLWFKNTITNANFEINKYCQVKIIIIEYSLIKKKRERKIHLILALPLSYMNENGIAVKHLLDYYQLKPEQLFIIHDDNDLLLGDFKIIYNQKSAGHKGVESVINNLNTQKFHRIKIGIHPSVQNKKIKAEEIVLKKITSQEQDILLITFTEIKKHFDQYLRQIIK